MAVLVGGGACVLRPVELCRCRCAPGLACVAGSTTSWSAACAAFRQHDGPLPSHRTRIAAPPYCTATGLYVWDDEDEDEGEGAPGGDLEVGGAEADDDADDEPLPDVAGTSTARRRRGPHLAAYLHYEQLLPVCPPGAGPQVGGSRGCRT